MQTYHTQIQPLKSTYIIDSQYTFNTTFFIIYSFNGNLENEVVQLPLGEVTGSVIITRLPCHLELGNHVI